jgi:hypothetical protein
VLGIRGVTAHGATVVGASHLKLTLSDDTGSIEAIGFGWADRASEDWWQDAVDVALRLERNVWRGNSTLQARIIEIRPSE